MAAAPLALPAHPVLGRRRLALVPEAAPGVVCRTVPGPVGAVDLPAAGQLTAVRPRVTVGVQGEQRHDGLLSELWVQVDPGLHEPDIAVVLTTDPDRVRAMRLGRPRVVVLAVVPASAAPGDVVALFDAGADECIRGTDTRVVAAHVTAVARRLLATR